VFPWRFAVVVIFSIAFAYIESAVVVYLRAIFHPDGFTFPLTVFELDAATRYLALTEIGREAATIALILSACWLFGRNRQQRFAYFMIIFAVWDIFYYVWLKAILDWPASLMTWDILFLIPMVWASPVLAPVLVSVIMFVFAVVILLFEQRGRFIRPSLTAWFGFISGTLAVIVSFCIGGIGAEKANYQSYFSWPLFAAGLAVAVATFTKIAISTRKNLSTSANSQL
jgi:hypothetical protein